MKIFGTYLNFSGNAKIDFCQKNKYNDNYTKQKNIQDFFERTTMDNNKNNSFNKRLENKLLNMCFEDTPEPKYENMDSYLDEDDCSVLVKDYFDNDNVLRKSTRELSIDGSLFNIDAFNKLGNLITEMIIKYTFDNKIVVYKNQYDGSEKSIALDSKTAVWDANEI